MGFWPWFELSNQKDNQWVLYSPWWAWGHHPTSENGLTVWTWLVSISKLKSFKHEKKCNNLQLSNLSVKIVCCSKMAWSDASCSENALKAAWVDLAKAFRERSCDWTTKSCTVCPFTSRGRFSRQGKADWIGKKYEKINDNPKVPSRSTSQSILLWLICWF